MIGQIAEVKSTRDSTIILPAETYDQRNIFNIFEHLLIKHDQGQRFSKFLLNLVYEALFYVSPFLSNAQ